MTGVPLASADRPVAGIDEMEQGGPAAEGDETVGAEDADGTGLAAAPPSRQFVFEA